MPVVLTDVEIEELIAQPKVLPPEFYREGALKPKRGHKERDIELVGQTGTEFVLILRQSAFNPLDFSAILGYRLPAGKRIFRLRRYNGKSHEHSNRLERQRFYDFHIHCATERYQRAGFAEDAFAEVTRRYANYGEAVECLLADAHCDTADLGGRLF